MTLTLTLLSTWSVLIWKNLHRLSANWKEKRILHNNLLSVTFAEPPAPVPGRILSVRIIKERRRMCPLLTNCKVSKVREWGSAILCVCSAWWANSWTWRRNRQQVAFNNGNVNPDNANYSNALINSLLVILNPDWFNLHLLHRADWSELEAVSKIETALSQNDAN